MLPFIVEEQTRGMRPNELSAWLLENVEMLESSLAEHGAILFRGAQICSTTDFECVCRTLTPELKSYVGGGSPRSKVDAGIYTSTEYSASLPIPLHCEGSYLKEMPRRVWFYCHKAAEVDGQTPLGDMRAVARRLPDGLVETWAAKGLTYITNLHDGKGFGKSWAQTYETEDRDELEEILKAQEARFEWTENGLRVFLDAPALRPHDDDGAQIWVNQAINWHSAHLGEAHSARMRKFFGHLENAPKHVRFGDGSEIPDADIAACCAALRAEEKVFQWQEGDVLLIDNQTVAHGRQPFEGERAIYVALA